MANKKQDGANVVQLEWATGRCPIHCEQCYANHSTIGQLQVFNVVKKKRWFKYATSQGWGPPKPDPKGVRLGKPTTRLMYLIPQLPKEYERKREKEVICADGNKYPLFLRIGSMSDSSLAPDAWLKKVRDVWGDYCFFNSAIRAIRSNPSKLRDIYHKVVITTNGGKQRYSKIGEPQNIDFVYGCMGAPKETPSDFFNPLTLSQIGLKSEEKKVKFYRVRKIPTIEPRFDTSVPDVATILRFKGYHGLLEFARRYKINAEVHSNTDDAKKASRLFGVKQVKIKEGQESRIYIWSDKEDDRNASEFRGEKTEYVNSRGWWRPIRYNLPWPYVCDRNNGSCQECGLCASLDGTYSDNENELNPIAPVPFADYYFGSIVDDSFRYFDWLLEGAFFEWSRNPSGGLVVEPMPLDWVRASLIEIRGYLDQAGEKETSYCEGWDTHEDVSTLLAFSFWCLLQHGKRHRWSKGKSIDYALDFCSDVFPPFSVIPVAFPDFLSMWDDDSDWLSSFEGLSGSM